MRIMLSLAMLALATPALAEPQCTDLPASQWIAQDSMKQSIIAEQGYKIDVFKITKGNCYELYGRNKAGKRIEIYYHPVTAEVVRQSVR